ncbi:MAG TPA: glycine/betaine/sarcosine/D-proline family reductase selenoprotein B, partial [Candidatus Binatia bacterium]|nr:glycine/betaine/sarcosine/D-proline family reductase selenoprotein B [Candidatus Binatia bacterium]
MRVVHYLNQFFAGIGGEEQAAMPMEIYDGPIGPGKRLEQLFGTEAQIVLSLVCGDNYATENQNEFIASAIKKIGAVDTDLLVAGPCFLAGRYGVAAGALCKAVQAQLGIPVVTGMARENPGADLYRESLYIIDSGESAAKMGEVLTRMARFAQKLSLKQEIGSPT